MDSKRRNNFSVCKGVAVQHTAFQSDVQEIGLGIISMYKKKKNENLLFQSEQGTFFKKKKPHHV